MVDEFALKLSKEISELMLERNCDLRELINAGIEVLEGSVKNANKRVD